MKEAKFGLSIPRGSEVRWEIALIFFSLSLLLMLGSGALRAHEEDVS
jgi:hypothetical protein